MKRRDKTYKNSIFSFLDEKIFKDFQYVWNILSILFGTDWCNLTLHLKFQVDVEGSELKVLPEWISSGILDHVDQFGIELHTGLVSIPNENLLTQLSNLMSIFRQLFAKGFRLISSMNNECVAKAQDSQGRYFNYFEIVFYKPDQGLL